ncbi:hypothetical protein ACFVWG_25280 [Kribbella sp. NPDC058245]|uniref:hypothetical protein n=1 Tax=Kribbella sp. NPDC058245 TaxID=3346399 RepID=UPI0036E4BD24
MTQTLANHRIRPLPRPSAQAGRIVRQVGYTLRLAPVGIQAMADAIIGRPGDASGRWQQMHPELQKPGGQKNDGQTHDGQTHDGQTHDGTAARGLTVFGTGLASAVMGLMSWFLLLLFVTSIARGPFYGLVEHGPYGPGTWGGPTRAGAWAVHAAVAIPVIVLIPLVLRGIRLLHGALIRRVYGLTAAKWVLPATILFCAGGMLFFWSWIQQL